MFKLCITGDLGFEVWLPIPRYETLYQASTYGRIRSTHKRSTTNTYDRMLKVDKDVRGYERVTLSSNKKTERFLVHRLIVFTFLPNFNIDDKYSVIDHIDTNPCNNCVQNLRICSQKENCNNPLTIKKLIGHYTNPESRMKKVIAKSLNGNVTLHFNYGIEAAKYFKTRRNCIYRVCQGLRNSHRGYIFSYV